MSPKSAGGPDPAPVEDKHQSRSELRVSWTQVLASAAAAVTAAFIASLFGVTGTIVGTAVISVVATTGSAIYNASLRRTNARLRKARQRLIAQQAQARRYHGASRPPPVGPTRPRWTSAAKVSETGAQPSETDSDQPEEHAPENDTTHTADISPPQAAPTKPRSAWQRRTPLLVGIASAFLLTVAALTVIELIGRQPISALTGGSGSAQGTTFFGDRSSPSPGPTGPTSSTTTAVSHPTSTIPVTTLRPAETTTPTTAVSTTTTATTPTTVASESTSTIPATTTATPP